MKFEIKGIWNCWRTLWGNDWLLRFRFLAKEGENMKTIPVLLFRRKGKKIRWNRSGKKKTCLLLIIAKAFFFTCNLA